tara:strand:+ start:1142 stop:1342 length:201 start_codon:yes stop_codon:yes gene_type:complete
MAYYIGTLEDCKAYDQNVSEKEGYQKGDNWANPQEIKGSWYILKHDKYSADLETVEELPQVDLEEI